MKKIYLVEAEECGLDMYDKMVVLADNAKEAIELCRDDDYENNDSWYCNGFVKDQGELTAREIDLNTDTSKIILMSFNAG